MLDPSFSLRFGFLRPLLWGCLQHFPCKPAGLPNSRSLWQLGWIYIHTYPYHESCVYMYIDIYISYFCKYVGLEAFPPCSIQQNLLLSYFPKLNKLQKKDLTTTNWTQAPRSDRIFHLPSEWGWGGGVSRCVSHMNHELGTGIFSGVLQHAVFKVPTFAAGGWKRGLDLWQNLRRFVFQWSLWPQAGIAQLQLLDLGISNAGTFWTTFFWGTFPLREGSSTTTVACGKWSVSMLELRTPGKFWYLLMFSSLVFLINRCINTWQSWLFSV